MSYASSLLASYPPTLLSDDLVTRTGYDNLYPPSVPYMSSGRLLSDDLAFNQMNYNSTTYHPSLYSMSTSTAVYPTTKYQKSFTTNQHPIVPSYDSLNDITEYSDSLATASNTNTASSVARSINENNINGPINIFSNSNQMPNNTNDHSIWSSPPTKSKGQSDQIKTKPTSVHKKSSANELNDDITPVPSPPPPSMSLSKQPNNLQRNATITDINKSTPSVDIQAWVNDTKKESPTDEKSAEQVWSVKIGQLHQVQAQREKEKIRSLRALPLAPKKVDSKPTTTKSKSITDTSYQTPNDTYLDSLFDGDYFRKPSTNDYSFNSALHQPISKRNKIKPQAFNNSNNLSKNPKYVPPRKTPRYEPPTTKRLPPPPPPPPIITTTSWRKQLPREHHFDSMNPYYLQNELAHRDFTHKDKDERFREALQKLRADRAEKQQKDINEKTAKRLHYGDYVRHSTKDALLQNAVKPSPWSDFMDLKKGNLYSLSQEEKRQLYNQSKSYGERIRYRNFALQHEAETARSHRHSVPILDDVQEPESGHATPRQAGSKSVSRTSRRPESASTNKSHTRRTGARGGNRTLPNPPNRTNLRTDRSNNIRPSDDEYENLSDYETNRKSKQQPKKKNVRYAKYDSFGRTTNGPDDSDNEPDNHSQRNLRMKNRDMNDDLFPVREDKTLESFEDARYKKR